MAMIACLGLSAFDVVEYRFFQSMSSLESSQELIRLATEGPSAVFTTADHLATTCEPTVGDLVYTLTDKLIEYHVTARLSGWWVASR